jgi:hypothetical protein
MERAKHAGIASMAGNEDIWTGKFLRLVANEYIE